MPVKVFILVLEGINRFSTLHLLPAISHTPLSGKAVFKNCPNVLRLPSRRAIEEAPSSVVNRLREFESIDLSISDHANTAEFVTL